MKYMFGEWLKEEIKKAGYTQTEFAALVDMNQSHLSRLLNGTRGVGQDTYVKIASVLRTPAEDVFRKAGFLPPALGKTEYYERLRFLVEQMNDQKKADLLDYADFLLRRK